MKHCWCVLLLFVTAAQAAGVRVPAFERVTLANGATLLLMPRRDVPLIAFEATIRGGSAADPAQAEGTASLLAGLLDKGAARRSAHEFAAAVDRVGGRIDAQARHEFVAISGSFLAQDEQLMVELLADMLQRPALQAAELDKLRARQIELIRAAKDSDLAGLVGVYAAAAVLPQHPYGRPVSGSESSLARVTLENVRDHYQQYFGADRLIVSVVGDFDVRAMQQSLTRALGQWQRAAAPLPTVDDPAAASTRQVLLIDAPDSTQSYFWLGTIGVSKTDPRRAAIDTVNAAFGGRYMSLLNTELRIKSGLTYGARSRFERFAHRGLWSIGSFTRAATTGAAIDLALGVLERLHAQGLSSAELASARQYVQGQFPLALETAADWAGMLSQMELYGLDRSYVEDYFAALERVDTTAARNVIDTVFARGGQLQLIVIGPAARIRDELRQYGALREMKLTEPQFGTTSQPAR